MGRGEDVETVACHRNPRNPRTEKLLDPGSAFHAVRDDDRGTDPHPALSQRERVPASEAGKSDAISQSPAVPLSHCPAVSSAGRLRYFASPALPTPPHEATLPVSWMRI